MKKRLTRRERKMEAARASAAEKAQTGARMTRREERRVSSSGAAARLKSMPIYFPPSSRSNEFSAAALKSMPIYFPPSSRSNEFSAAALKSRPLGFDVSGDAVRRDMLSYSAANRRSSSRR